MKKIRTGDEVIVITGKSKGKIGKVLRVLDEHRVIVEGVNIAKKHTKPNPAKNITGGVLDKTLPIHVSNIDIYNPTTKKADRVGFKTEGNKKVRILKSTGNVVGS